MAVVFRRDIGNEALRAFRPLTKNPVTRRLETAMTRRMRIVFREELANALRNAKRDGSLPYRTGKGYRILLRGTRAFGTRFANLRGHIVGPDYMAAQEKGAKIVPQNAQALAIPIYDGLRPDGTPKLPGPNSWRLHRSFIYKSKRTGQLYIARRREDGTLSILYVLVSMVELTKNKDVIERHFEARLFILFQRFGDIFLDEISKIDIDKTYVQPKIRGGRRG